MADEQQVDFNALKGRLEEYTPVPHVTHNFGWVLIAVHQVVGQLVNVIEAQEARIKALEDRPAISTYPKVYKDHDGELRVLLMDGRSLTWDEFKAQFSGYSEFKVDDHY